MSTHVEIVGSVPEGQLGGTRARKPLPNPIHAPRARLVGSAAAAVHVAFFQCETLRDPPPQPVYATKEPVAKAGDAHAVVNV